jgi:hypothetical protein
MRATDFEYRHQTLLHLVVVGLAFLTYTIQPDDIVWALVKNHTTARTLERLVFGTGTIMIVSAVALQTWVAAYQRPDVAKSLPAFDLPYYFGRLLFAFGIGQLAPALGTTILLAGEIFLVLRLQARNRNSEFSLQKFAANWKAAFRKESSKWGLAVTMIVFTLTLKDRVAEILAVASFLLWVALNMANFLPARQKRG